MFTLFCLIYTFTCSRTEQKDKNNDFTKSQQVLSNSSQVTAVYTVDMLQVEAGQHSCPGQQTHSHVTLPIYINQHFRKNTQKVPHHAP